MSFMSNSANKKPIQVGILEISAQNKAILEFFFSGAGKSYFKEVSVEKASAYIIDYDSLGAKESWKTRFEETKKPGIIISIKEIDLPSTIWLQKPLTVKALKDAGESIREMMLKEDAKDLGVAVAPVIEETKIKEKEIVGDIVNEEIIQEIIEEKNQDDKPLIDDSLIDEMVETPNETIDEILFVDQPLESNSTKKQEEQEDNIDVIDIIELPELSIKKELVTESIKENVIEDIVESTEVVQATAPEETLQLDNLLIDDFLESPKEELIKTTDEEVILEIEADDAVTLVEEQKEPELALAETDTSVSASASSTDYASSDNFIDIDLSLDIDATSDSTIQSETKDKISSKQENILPKISVDIPEVASTNDDMDSLLESLISGGESNVETDEVVTSIVEDNTESDLLDFDLETNEGNNENNIIDTRAENIASEAIEAKPVGITVDDIEIEKILQGENKAEAPEKSAEEELQALLEEIRQEADGTSGPDSQNSTSSRAQTYSPTDAEERWKLTCGTNKDNIDIQKLATFEPSNHILTTIVQNIEIAKQNKETLRVKFKGVIVVIDPETDNIYCDRSIFTEFYANICYEPITKDKIKIHNLDASELRLYRKKMQEDEERTHCTEAFIWTTSLLTSRGRLPKMTNIQSKVGLNAWPNMTRVENIPHMMQIAALFHKNTWSLLEISNKSGVSKKYVIAFYNAALALNMIETNGASVSSASLDLKKSKNKNRSFFSRFLKKITA